MVWCLSGLSVPPFSNVNVHVVPAGSVRFCRSVQGPTHLSCAFAGRYSNDCAELSESSCGGKRACGGVGGGQATDEVPAPQRHNTTKTTTTTKPRKVRFYCLKFHRVYCYPRESFRAGLCNHRRTFVCLSVCLFVCLFVTTITK